VVRNQRVPTMDNLVYCYGELDVAEAPASTSDRGDRDAPRPSSVSIRIRTRSHRRTRGSRISFVGRRV